ncbi:trypsin-like serine protease [Streptomyces sp. SD11]|uniref:trypsin-like serine protease n=1 Tax=Streptomyces sp. SD11 TaxID=3452209 RepID=UPI003F8949A7
MANHRSRTALTCALLATSVATGLLIAPAAHAVNGDESALDAYNFTTRLDIGDGARRCSGALVDPYWVLTAASCFADDPDQSFQIRAGKPSQATTAVVGRVDTTSTSGQSRAVVELVPRTDRDLVLARLDRPVTGIAPVPVGSAMPTTGETLTSAGFGRTDTEWAPLRMHHGQFSVDSVGISSVNITGKNGNALCAGDTGGPLFRVSGSTTELIAVNSRSWQGGCLGSTETRTGAVETRLDDISDWIGTRVKAARITDFNGDGVRDTAVADPQATVGSVKKAGVVRVVLGGGRGTAEISQSAAGVTGAAETDDQFGEALAVVDHNLDGYTDLVVGTPGEDIGDAADAGLVQVLYGSADGIAKGRAELGLEQGKGEGGIAASASEAGDRMGHALAAGTTTAGEPYLLIGVPGEDLDGFVDAGSSFYLRSKTNRAISQGSVGVHGAVEKGDRFGTTVAGSPEHLVIGTPHEAIGTNTDSGGLEILSHSLNAEGIPTALAGIDQDSTTPEINGAAEAGDKFAASLAMTSYRLTTSSATAATDSVLAIGTPGENDGALADSGRVVTLRVTAAGSVTQLADIHQNVANVTGDPEAGDHFGEQVSAVATAPGAVSTTKNALIVVGIPGEDIGSVADAGSVAVFTPIGAPGDSEVVVEPGKAGLPGTSGAGQVLGAHIAASGTHLYLGMPKGPGQFGSAYALPWANVTDAATGTVTTYAPGTDGLPAAGVAFGSVIR